jgi:hypothetical protein
MLVKREDQSINRELPIKVKQNNLYKLYLKKLLCGSGLDLSETELKILCSIRNNVYVWDLFKLEKSIGISRPNLNNYKKKLKDKRLLIQDSKGEYRINPDIELPISSEIKEYILTFRITVDEETTTNPRELEDVHTKSAGSVQSS